MTKNSEKILVGGKNRSHQKWLSIYRFFLQNKYNEMNDMNEMVHTRSRLRWNLSLIGCCVQLHYGTVQEVRCDPFVQISRLCTGNWTQIRPYNAIPLCNAIQHRPRIERNRPFAASHSRGTKPPCWNAKVALGQDKQRKLPFKIMYAFYL